MKKPFRLNKLVLLGVLAFSPNTFASNFDDLISEDCKAEVPLGSPPNLQEYFNGLKGDVITEGLGIIQDTVPFASLIPLNEILAEQLSFIFPWTPPLDPDELLLGCMNEWMNALSAQLDAVEANIISEIDALGSEFKHSIKGLRLVAANVTLAKAKINYDAYMAPTMWGVLNSTDYQYSYTSDSGQHILYQGEVDRAIVKDSMDTLEAAILEMRDSLLNLNEDIQFYMDDEQRRAPFVKLMMQNLPLFVDFINEYYLRYNNPDNSNWLNNQSIPQWANDAVATAQSLKYANMDASGSSLESFMLTLTEIRDDLQAKHFRSEDWIIAEPVVFPVRRCWVEFYLDRWVFPWRFVEAHFEDCEVQTYGSKLTNLHTGQSRTFSWDLPADSGSTAQLQASYSQDLIDQKAAWEVTMPVVIRARLDALFFPFIRGLINRTVQSGQDYAVRRDHYGLQHIDTVLNGTHSDDLNDFINNRYEHQGVYNYEAAMSWYDNYYSTAFAKYHIRLDCGGGLGTWSVYAGTTGDMEVTYKTTTGQYKYNAGPISNETCQASTTDNVRIGLPVAVTDSGSLVEIQLYNNSGNAFWLDRMTVYLNAQNAQSSEVLLESYGSDNTSGWLLSEQIDDGPNDSARSCYRFSMTAYKSDTECDFATVEMGSTVWTSTNLDVAKSLGGNDIGWCWNPGDTLQRDDNAYCQEFGRLYDLEEAKLACRAIDMRLPSRSDFGHKQNYHIHNQFIDKDELLYIIKKHIKYNSITYKPFSIVIVLSFVNLTTAASLEPANLKPNSWPMFVAASSLSLPQSPIYLL
ncbi:MAG: hypothetical protein MJK04_27755, partial [Psychrosphaera sp.]|nr:hypothetical protein [Psychrosphaera sp.]